MATGAVPRASPPRGLAFRTPLHSVCVLLARPTFRGTRLYGVVFLVHPIGSGLLLRTCMLGPCSQGHCSRDLASSAMLVAVLRIASLLPAGSDICLLRSTGLLPWLPAFWRPVPRRPSSRGPAPLCSAQVKKCQTKKCCGEQLAVQGGSEFGPPLSLHPFAPVRSCDVAARLSARSRASSDKHATYELTTKTPYGVITRRVTVKVDDTEVVMTITDPFAALWLITSARPKISSDTGWCYPS